MLEPVHLAAAGSYAAMLTRAQAAVAAGGLEVVAEASAPAQARHIFACTQCAQLFILERGGGDRFGDHWRPLHGN